MLDAYPSDLRDFVIQKIAEGSFRTADEFAVAAASLYRELDMKRRELQSLVAEGDEALGNGAYSEISDEESLEFFFEQIKSRGRQLLRDSTDAK